MIDRLHGGEVGYASFQQQISSVEGGGAEPTEALGDNGDQDGYVGASSAIIPSVPWESNDMNERIQHNNYAWERGVRLPGFGVIEPDLLRRQLNYDPPPLHHQNNQQQQQQQQQQQGWW